MFKKIIVTILLGTFFLATSVNASVKLELEECVIGYAGDSCSSELKIINDVEELSDAEITITMYQKDVLFDGIGIDITYNEEISIWNEGTLIFFTPLIEIGTTIHTLKMKTHPALVPDYYSYGLTFVGNFEEEYIEITGGGGGGGGWNYIPLTNNEISTTTNAITTTTIGMTNEEIKVKITEIQQQLIILIYKLIIEFMKQLITLS